MKKIILAVTVLAGLCSSAQEASNRLTFVKGQKLEVVTNTSVQAESMMGPASGTIAISDVHAVYTVAENAVSLTKLPKQMKIAFRSGSQEIKVDSDNPNDLSGPLGEPVREIMGLKPEFTIDAEGKIVAVKKDPKSKESSPEAAGMMAMMMPGMNMAAVVPREGSASLFQVLPGRKVGIGDTWTDSLNAEGNKSITVYRVKEITEKEIILDFSGNGHSVTSQSLMGQTIQVSVNTKGNGTVILDKATGILKQKTVTSTSETSMNFGGQEMTSTAKTTAVTNVNVL